MKVLCSECYQPLETEEYAGLGTYVKPCRRCTVDVSKVKDFYTEVVKDVVGGIELEFTNIGDSDQAVEDFLAADIDDYLKDYDYLLTDHFGEGV